MKSQIEQHLERQPSKETIDKYVKSGIRGMAISKKMLAAAQGSYDSWEEYGITDADMTKAIKAAMMAYGK